MWLLSSGLIVIEGGNRTFRPFGAKEEYNKVVK